MEAKERQVCEWTTRTEMGVGSGREARPPDGSVFMPGSAHFRCAENTGLERPVVIYWGGYRGLQ